MSVTWHYTLVLLLHSPQDFFSVPSKTFLFLGFLEIFHMQINHLLGVDEEK
jgi:hypothetical protein